MEGDVAQRTAWGRRTGVFLLLSPSFLAWLCADIPPRSWVTFPRSHWGLNGGRVNEEKMGVRTERVLTGGTEGLPPPPMKLKSQGTWNRQLPPGHTLGGKAVARKSNWGRTGTGAGNGQPFPQIAVVWNSGKGLEVQAFLSSGAAQQHPAGRACGLGPPATRVPATWPPFSCSGAESVCLLRRWWCRPCSGDRGCEQLRVLSRGCRLGPQVLRIQHPEKWQLPLGALRKDTSQTGHRSEVERPETPSRKWEEDARGWTQRLVYGEGTSGTLK